MLKLTYIVPLESLLLTTIRVKRTVDYYWQTAQLESLHSLSMCLKINI